MHTLVGEMTPVDRTQLYDLVAEHQVVFELRRTNAIVRGTRAQIGFDLELYGTHGEAVASHEEPMPPPGCPRCEAVWNDLRMLAEVVLPPDDRQSTYRIDPFDGTLSFDRKRKRGRFDRPDVRLVIEVRHREGYDQPIDACETQCVQEMIAALRALGVQEGSWNAWTAAIFRRDHAHDLHEGG